jgi:hypothetical protein
MSDFTQPEIPLLSYIKNPPVELETSWFPETIGWKILLLILVIFLTKRGIGFYKKWKSNEYRRLALRELEKQNVSLLEFSKTLKETIRFAYPENYNNRLNKEDLYNLLMDKITSNNIEKELFFKWQDSLLMKNKEITKEERETIKIFVFNWIKTHKKEGELK